MCLVCVELIKQKMSILEAERNLSELSKTERDRKLATHYQDLYDAMIDGDFETVGRLLSPEENEDEME